MSIFDNAMTTDPYRENERQIRLSRMPESDRATIEGADRDARAMRARMDKLVKEGRSGTMPIQSADASDLDAIYAAATSIWGRVSGYDEILTDGIRDTVSKTMHVIEAERNRRYRVRVNQRMRASELRNSFVGPLEKIARNTEGFLNAMDELSFDVLLGPNPVLTSRPTVPDPEQAQAMTDSELDAAIGNAYMAARFGLGVSAYADDVARFADALPRVIKAMRSYAKKEQETESRAAEVHKLLLEEKNRRKADAERRAAANSVAIADRISSLERELERLRSDM